MKRSSVALSCYSWGSDIYPRARQGERRLFSPVRCDPLLLQRILYLPRRFFRISAGLSVITIDEDDVDHSIVIEVKDPHSLDSACPAGVSPCLADGALRVVIDGQETLAAPGSVFVGQGVEIMAANLPGACRSFGFEKVRNEKQSWN